MPSDHAHESNFQGARAERAAVDSVGEEATKGRRPAPSLPTHPMKRLTHAVDINAALDEGTVERDFEILFWRNFREIDERARRTRHPDPSEHSHVMRRELSSMHERPGAATQIARGGEFDLSGTGEGIPSPEMGSASVRSRRRRSCPQEMSKDALMMRWRNSSETEHPWQDPDQSTASYPATHRGVRKAECSQLREGHQAQLHLG